MAVVYKAPAWLKLPPLPAIKSCCLKKSWGLRHVEQIQQADDRMFTRAVVKSAMDLSTKAFCLAELIKAERQAEEID
ncbi:MAG: hypothetical protein ACI89D_001166 [Bermanella sp.]